MEELQCYQAEEQEKLRRDQHRSSIHLAGAGAGGEGALEDDATFGGDDEVDWFEAGRHD